jgi:hypothetical protein
VVKDSPSPGDHGSINHPAVNLNSSNSRFGGHHNTFRPSNLGLARTHGRVDGFDLLGMDA